MLKDAAMNWINANCKDPKLRSDFSRQLKSVLQRRVDCWFALGSGLTRQRVPYMIHCFAGELFIFQLSAAQAAGLMLAPDALCSSSDSQPGESRPTAPPISLANFELDRPILTETERITGSCSYEIEGEIPASYCLRLDCLLGLAAGDTIWSDPGQILGRSGHLRFSFDAIRETAWPIALFHRGPAAVFLRVCTFPIAGDAASRHPISNACGTLVDISKGLSADQPPRRNP